MPRKNNSAPAALRDIEASRRLIMAHVLQVDRKLDAAVQRLALDNFKSQDRVSGLEEGLRKDMRRVEAVVAEKLDAFMTKLQTIWRESAVLPLVIDRHGDTLKEHHERLLRLESRA